MKNLILSCCFVVGITLSGLGLTMIFPSLVRADLCPYTPPCLVCVEITSCKTGCGSAS